jgi:hypothetical protein
MRLVFRLLSALPYFFAAPAQAETRVKPALNWQIFKVPDFGTRLEYPASIFAAVGQAETGVGQRFEREDGRAVLSIYARGNVGGDTPAGYLKKNLRQSALGYERVTRSFFAISMERREQSITADAISRALFVVPSIVLIWYIQRLKSVLGILW